jgi:tetratricopeptide (TPR) repeat protein
VRIQRSTQVTDWITDLGSTIGINDWTVMSATQEQTGTLDVALKHTARLLETAPALAAEQAQEILKAVPRQPSATLMLGVAQRATGQLDDSLRTLTALVDAHASWALAQFELARSLGAARQGEAAISALRRAVQLKVDLPDAWRTLGDHLTAIGEVDAADEAYRMHIRHSTRDPRLMEAAAALCDNRIAIAESLLRAHLKQHPTDVAAIRMLAEVAARLGRLVDAENLLARCLELSPGFVAARHNYAVVLHRQNKTAEALVHIDRALSAEAMHPAYRNLRAAILSRLGDYEESIKAYAGVLEDYPNNAKVWMSYGHALKTAGKQDAAIEAYRRSIVLAPDLGEVWWSLANLKTVKFSAADVQTMREQLRRPELNADHRLHFEFALGKALEDEGDFADSFRHYESGNALRRKQIDYSAEANSAYVRRAKQVFTRELFDARRGWGASHADPIFIVGLPRSGSTLLEQILSSHPLVEGTQELPNVIAIARSLSGDLLYDESSPYPGNLAGLSADAVRTAGERYIAETRAYRHTDAPFFIDKMPNNFAHVGLIHLMLPNAKIIDARRHPLGCCFSCFKQHFARGQHFTYGLDDIGRYYHDYVELMAHFDAVLPGRVHRVIYETLVENFETEVRRVLAYCALPFDERCLKFHENERAVRTASSEQVRRPLYKDAVDHWRNYEAWLGPLKDALGPVLPAYPDAPEF